MSYTHFTLCEEQMAFNSLKTAVHTVYMKGMKFSSCLDEETTGHVYLNRET